MICNITKSSAIETQAAVAEIRAKLAWYCLRSLSKHEHIAAANLRMLEGVTVFCPRIRFKRATRRGLVWVTEAVFPCYLFARFDLAKMHRGVLYAHGVSGIVRFGDRYPIIEEESLAQLRAQIGVTEVKEVIYEFSQGDQVRITKGVFLGLQAVVTQVLSATQRVRILMDFLGRQTEAEVENASLLPQVAHPLAA
jgi:transcriptional antiterminator RfaH